MKSVLIVLAAMASMAASPDASTVSTFVHGGGTATMPLPAGYCIPQGGPEFEFANDTKANAPTSNVYSVMLRCDRPYDFLAPDYIIIKAPNSGQYSTTPISRGALIKKLSAIFASKPDLVALNARLSARASDSASKLAGDKVQLSQVMEPRGADADCFYVGGILKIQAGGKSVSLVSAECITSVNEHMIAVVLYRAGADVSVLPGLFAEVRTMAVSMNSATNK